MAQTATLVATGTKLSASVTHTIPGQSYTAGTRVRLFLGSSSDFQATAVSGGGVTWTKEGANDGLFGRWAVVFRSSGTPSAGDLTVTFDGAADNFGWIAVEQTGVADVTGDTGFATATSTTPSSTVGGDGVGSGNAIIGLLLIGADRSFTPDAGTLVADLKTGTSHEMWVTFLDSATDTLSGTINTSTAWSFLVLESVGSVGVSLSGAISGSATVAGTIGGTDTVHLAGAISGAATLAGAVTDGDTTFTVTLDRPAYGEAPALVMFTATLANGGSATVTMPILPQDPDGLTTIDAFYVSATSTASDTITLTWAVSNPPSGVTYDLAWNNNHPDHTGTETVITGVTSPYAHGALSHSLDIGNKGDSGFVQVIFNYQLRMKDGLGTVVATKDLMYLVYGDYTA